MAHKIKSFTSYIFLFLILVLLIGCSTNEKTYTMTFDTGFEAQVSPIIATEGESIFAPNNPVRPGYRFDGWFNGQERYQFGLMPNQNLTLTAKWSKYYQVSFETADGTSIQPITVAEGDPIVLPEIPKRNSYKFTGWTYLDAQFSLSHMPSQDVILIAQWAPASTITFMASVFDRYLNSYVDIELETIVEIAGTQIQAPQNPTYPEYKFLSWKHEGHVYDFTTMPDTDITLYAEWLQLSNLPALFINLYHENGSIIPIEQINRETYVHSIISLENTSAEYQLIDLVAEFKGRGNGSWVDSGDKRGYRIKFDKKQSVLGQPESKHWVILAGANFDDVTMFRNKLAFDMSNEVFSHIEYASSAEWVDVYFNGNYHGVYLMAEQVRVDTNRVNIVSEYGVLDTGYFIEYDSYASGVNGVDYFRVDGLRYPFTMKSPSPDDYLENGLTLDDYKAQVAYIRSIVQNMVTAAMTKNFEAFATYADVDSFVDMYILHELFKNIDTGYSSFFLYRHAGGKLFAGPPWDFDATLGSSPSRGNGGPTGIYVAQAVQAFSSRTASELLISLYNTPGYKQAVVQRWQEISPNIQSYVNQVFTNEMVQTYRFAMGRNYVRWPSPQGYGAPISQTTAEQNWANNISILKKWLLDRVSWLNGEWS
jgi:uncharacterized repeat protein (TIGR02543 family)